MNQPTVEPWDPRFIYVYAGKAGLPPSFVGFHGEYGTFQDSGSPVGESR